MPDQIVWLSTVQAAYRLGETSTYVRHLIRSNKLAAIRVGDRLRIREDHLTAYQERKAGHA